MLGVDFNEEWILQDILSREEKYRFFLNFVPAVLRVDLNEVYKLQNILSKRENTGFKKKKKDLYLLY